MAPGWYQLPDQPDRMAWWDGTGWDATTVRPKEAAPSQPHAGQPAATPTSTRRTTRTIVTQVQVMRRVRPRRLPCGHCSAKLPRFTAWAPAVVVCPNCSGHTQVMEGALFRRGYAVE
jgi:hypothetical protein